MLVLIAIENGVKKIIPLTADAGAGNPVGTVIVVCSNQIPSNYLPLGTQYDTSLYPVLYALLGTDTTPTASALGLPTLTSGQYAIKATSGLSENAQDNVINTLNEQRSYSTEEVNTGKKWIDGKPIYRKVLNINGYPATIQTGLTSANEVVGMACKNTVGGSDDNFVFGGILTDNNVYYPWAYQLSSDNTTLSRITSTYSGTVKFIILEYTKTN
jgi:hypothetical protein